MDRRVAPSFIAVSLLVGTSFVARPAMAAAPFVAPIESPSTAVPYGLVAADFDGDGKPDVVVADPNQNGALFQHGNGDGTFASPVLVASGSNPGLIRTADLDGNGTMDVVTAAAVTPYLTVLLGNGDGTFSVGQTLATGGVVLAFRILDYNDDGIPDLAVMVTGSNTLLLYPGNGDGSFGTPLSLAVGFQPEDAAVADLDGDGLPDLVLTDINGKRIAVYHATAKGVFGAPKFIATVHYPEFLELVPDAASGRVDIVASEDEIVSVGGWIETFTAGGSGSFSSTLYPFRAQSMDMVAADFNGDGVPDLVVMQPYDDSVSVLLGQGAGVYGAAMTYRTGYSPTSVAVADVDGDGKPDIITSSPYFGDVDVERNVGGGMFAAPQSEPFLGASTYFQPIAAPMDFEHTGFADLLAFSSYTQGSDKCVAVLREHNDGQGSFTPDKTSVLGCSPFFSAGGAIDHQAELVDMDGDGIPDLVTLGSTGTTAGILVAHGNGDGTFGAAVIYAGGGTASPYADFVVGDVDGDGRPDVVAVKWTVGVDFYMQQTDGSLKHTFSAPITMPLFPNSFHLVTLADLNHDGRPLLVATDTYNPQLAVYPIVVGTGLGTPVYYSFTMTSGTGVVKAVDLNGDGYDDLIISSQYGVGVLLNDGAGNLQAEQIYSSGNYCFRMTLVDFDGDGKPDAACLDKEGSGFTLYFNNGDGTLTPGPGYAGLEGGYSISAGDLNGDGKPDLVIGDYFTYPVQAGDDYGDPFYQFSVVYQASTATLPPLSVAGHYYTYLDQSLEVPRLGLDRTGAAVTYSVVVAPQHGTLSPSPSVPQDLVYTPAHHYKGYDDFVIKTTSVNGASTAPVSIQVLDDNHAPVPIAAAYDLSENQLEQDKFSAVDADGDTITYQLDAGGLPQHGTLTLNDASSGSFTYTPAHDYVGGDHFIFEACDWESCGFAAVTVNITAPGGGDGVPTADTVKMKMTENTVTTGKLSGADTDGDGLAYSIVQKPHSGTVHISNAGTGAFSYTPNRGYVGTDYFIYQVSDGAFTAQGQVEVVVSQSYVGPPTPPPAKSGGGGAFSFGLLGLLTLLAALQRKLKSV